MRISTVLIFQDFNIRFLFLNEANALKARKCIFLPVYRICLYNHTNKVSIVLFFYMLFVFPKNDCMLCFLFYHICDIHCV